MNSASTAPPIAFLLLVSTAFAEQELLDPRMTFLTTDDSDDQNLFPLRINLHDYGIRAGSTITIRTIGDFLWNPGQTLQGTNAVAVFSSTMQCLTTEFAERVPNPLSCNAPSYPTSPTPSGKTTDIEDDFFVGQSPVTVVVPTAATPCDPVFLFVGANDVWWEDNTDPEGDFHIVIELESGSTIVLGPTPYLGKANSPFVLSSQSYFVEDFEDGQLDIPGVLAFPGAPIPPSASTDSVDADDGAITGSGINGWSFFSIAGSAGITILFDPQIIGATPTHVGVVWTDGAGLTTFEAFGSCGELLARIGPIAIADGVVDGTTAEDRFFGLFHSEGVAKIRIENTLGGIEIDHIQYGRVEPSTSMVGTRCGRTNSHLGATAPKLGESVVVTLTSSAASASGTLFVGLPSPVPIPLGAGCSFHLLPHSISLSIPLMLDSFGNWSGGATLPDAPLLAGVEVALQAAIYPTLSTLGFDVTQCLILELGT